MLPATWYTPTPNVPDSALHRSPELRGQYDALPFFGDPSDTAATEIVRAYHAAVRYADAQVGKVLQALQDSAAAKNTLVVVLGDHGFYLGEQRLWTKHGLFEPALRTPLIISHPSLAGAAGQAEDFVSDLLDVYPTVVDLAGLDRPAHVEGESLQALLAGSQTDRDNKRSIARWMNGESVRGQRFRYTRWFTKDGNTTDQMLFDLSVDPLEQNNLVDHPDYVAVRDDLGAYLDTKRSDPVWSEALDTPYGRWQMAASSIGGVLLVALAYPIPAIAGLLLVLLLVAVMVWRYRRRRSG